MAQAPATPIIGTPYDDDRGYSYTWNGAAWEKQPLGYLLASRGIAPLVPAAIGDHIPFATIQQSSGTSIVLDTASIYTNLAGASVGRITLKPNKSYQIEAFWVENAQAAGVNNQIVFGVYNLTTASFTGNTGMQFGKDKVVNTMQAPATAVIQTGLTPEVIEIRKISGLPIAPFFGDINYGGCSLMILEI